MSEQDLLSADHSPDASHGIRRINNRVLYFICAIMLVFVFFIVLATFNHKNTQKAHAADAHASTDNTSLNYAETIAGNYRNGMVPAAPPEKTTGSIHSKPQKTIAPQSPVQPNAVASGKQLAGVNSEQVAERRQMREAKRQAFQQALLASPSIPTGNLSQQYGNTVHKASFQSGTGGSVAHPHNAPISRYGQFDRQGAGDRWQLNALMENPRSPFEVRAGFVMPAIMISGINSDLAGQITAQVAQNVYDTPTGNYLLIPQGSRLVGTYSSQVNYGQARVLVAWQRIIFPDGRALDVGAMPGADQAGYSGFTDQVNNHYVRLFSSAFLMSAITAGVTLSQDQGRSDRDRMDASSALSEALGQQLGQVTAQMIAKNLNISPTLEIRPGYRFNVMLTKDLDFNAPYSRG
jgi:type IV secretory pathway VirB10-like protein